MKKILDDFRKFAMANNIIGMATGVIIGGAAGAVVTALVNGIIMPFIGILLGGNNIDGLKFTIAGVDFMYGLFISAFIDFIIILFCVFLMMRAYTKMTQSLGKKLHLEEEKKEKEPTSEDYLKEIRDLLAEERKQ